MIHCTVCLQIGQSQGTGVIVNRDGYILTAGHVSGPAGKDGIVILHDGRRLRGKTLGANNSIDSGMVLLADRMDVPYAEMAKSSEIRKGQWCISLGHPGGFKPGRTASVRLGRILEIDGSAIVTDCILVGGDSGGPLFDMHGKVIGINSRIGDKIDANIHVPVDTFRDTWTRLASGEVWGSKPSFVNSVKPAQAYLGVKAAEDMRALKIESITPNSPAEKAGLRANDTILQIDNQQLVSIAELAQVLKARPPGAQIIIHVQRGYEMMAVSVVLGKRAN